MTDTCPICAQGSPTLTLNVRYSGLICGRCLDRYPRESVCGGSIEFGNTSVGGGFESKIDGEETDPAQHFFVLVKDGAERIMCHADEHRFGGIVYTRATRTREEAIRITQENALDSFFGG